MVFVKKLETDWRVMIMIDPELLKQAIADAKAVHLCHTGSMTLTQEQVDELNSRYTVADEDIDKIIKELEDECR